MISYSIQLVCVAITPVHDTPDAIRVRQKHAPCIAQYTSLKDAIISLIDGKVRHEYDRLKVSAARESVGAIAYYSTVPLVYLSTSCMSVVSKAIFLV